MATGAPFEGTSDAIPAAAETGLELVVLLPDSFAPAVPLVVVFTKVLVPGPFVDHSLQEREKRKRQQEREHHSTTSTSAPAAATKKLHFSAGRVLTVVHPNSVFWFSFQGPDPLHQPRGRCGSSILR